MSMVRQILNTKGKEVWSVPSQASVFEALRLMSDKNIGAVLVTLEGGSVGIFSERDYARAGVSRKNLSFETPVKELMTKMVYNIRPEADMEECMMMFTEKRIRHLPVMEDGNVIGIISIGDVVNNVISEQQMTIRELGKYIYGG